MEDVSTDAGWEDPDQVRRTIMLPRETERALADAAQRRQISPSDLIRELIMQGLARLGDEKHETSSQ
jgi:hypothetical protein